MLNTRGLQVTNKSLQPPPGAEINTDFTLSAESCCGVSVTQTGLSDLVLHAGGDLQKKTKNKQTINSKWQVTALFLRFDQPLHDILNVPLEPEKQLQCQSLVSRGHCEALFSELFPIGGGIDGVIN